MGLKAFLRENAKQPENVMAVISQRFCDENGEPEPWELKAVGEKENASIKDECTTKEMKRGRSVSQFNGSLYTRKLMAASVVSPDLMDSQLQESYGVVGAERLLEEMLLPGEYATLNERVSELCGFDLDEEISKVKNF